MTDKRVTINSLREDLERHQAEVDKILLDETARREVSPSLWNERDIMFQIRVMDWMIGLCVVVMVVVLCVGVWAIWMMVTRGWLW